MGNRFIDKSTDRKNQIVKSSLAFVNEVPLFSIVEFNIINSCNRSCDFCPISNPDIYTKTNGQLDLHLFEKIVKDLQEIKYEGKILFSAFSEPLLYKKLEELVVISKKHLPKIRLEIVSNGDLLTPEKLGRLVEVGLDTINISLYDGEHQVGHFNNMQKQAGVIDGSIVLRRRYYKDGNYGITISNRSGLVKSNHFRDSCEQQILDSDLPLKQPCYYPFYMMVIDYNGDVLLCPHDWKKTIKIGNLHNEKIFSIWNGKTLDAIRKKLYGSERDFAACKMCDVLGTVIGKESFNAWSGLM